MGMIPHISYVFDEGFLEPTLISLYSLCNTSKSDIEVTLFVPYANDHMKTSVDKLNRHFPRAEISIVEDACFELALETSTHVTSAAYGRLLINRFLDRKTIYLDGDTIVQSDIAELYDHDLSGNPLGACRDTNSAVTVHAATRRFFPKIRAGYRKFQAIPAHFDPTDYCNSGVLIFDFPRIDAIEMTWALDPNLADEAKMKYGWTLHDQDWINNAFRGKICLLPAKWNAIWGNDMTYIPNVSFKSMVAYSDSRKRPAILHFAGGGKPWLNSTPKRMIARGGLYRIYQKVQSETNDIILG